MMRNYHLRFRRVGSIFDPSILWVFMELLRRVRLYGRPYARAKKAISFFFLRTKAEGA